MYKEKWNEDRRNADRNKPLIADMTLRMKYQPFCRELFVQLGDQRLERSSLEL